MAEKAFEEWAILELMGHRRLAGLVREVSIGGASFIRIDVPGVGFVEWSATQFYNPAAVYCMTPVSEELARQVAMRDQPEPVTYWELSPPEQPKERPPVEKIDFDEGDCDPDDGEFEKEESNG